VITLVCLSHFIFITFFEYSIRRSGGCQNPCHTITGRILIGLAIVIIAGGIFTAVIVPLSFAAAKAPSENAETIRKKITL
jgi:hypothetical protein